MLCGYTYADFAPEMVAEMVLYQGTASAVPQDAAIFKGFRRCLTNPVWSGFVSGHGFSRAVRCRNFQRL
jgi:hypothetical protein